MKKDESKSKKRWEIFLAVLSALLGALFSKALEIQSNSTSQAIPVGQKSASSDFFTISTSMITPLLYTGFVVAGSCFLLLLFKVLDFFDLFDFFDGDFWDFH